MSSAAVELAGHMGIRPGDIVRVIGWTSTWSVDYRKVVAIYAVRCCQGGVMLVIDRPLRNQNPMDEFNSCPVPNKTWISAAWTKEGGKA